MNMYAMQLNLQPSRPDPARPDAALMRADAWGNTALWLCLQWSVRGASRHWAWLERPAFPASCSTTHVSSQGSGVKLRRLGTGPSWSH